MIRATLVHILLAFALAASAFSQPALTLEDLLAEAETALATVKASDVLLLSPRRVAKAEENLREARNQMGKAGTDNIVRVNLESALESLETAQAHADQARTKMQTVLEARKVAQAAGAGQNNLPTWQQAERGLVEMASKFENGEESELAGLQEPLAQQYYAARREALRDGFLAKTKSDISAAEKAGADVLFPTLMARSRQAISRAEAQLAQENFDECKVSAEEASRVALHAKGQTEFVNKAKSTRMPEENMLLPYDDLLQRMAMEWGDTLSFEQGGEGAVNEVKVLFEKRLEREVFVQDSLEKVVKVSHESMERALTDMQTSLADQQNRMTEYEQRVLDIQAERDIAVNRLRRNELTAQRAQLAQTAFDPGDAVVYQTMEGNIVIHLYGLKFASGQATLGKVDKSILKKAAEAIAVFPDVKVIVEGHTDGEGSEESNQELSEKRAAAVGQALEGELRSKAKIETVGKGESSPIASNETVRGRALNRRIDLVLTIQ